MKISSAAVATLGEVLRSIETRSKITPWDTANQHMRGVLLECKESSKSKKEFITAAKKVTGIIRNKHPLLLWCCNEWY